MNIFNWKLKNMKKSKNRKKLTTKFIFLYIILIGLPIIGISTFSFSQFNSSARNEIWSSLEHSMESELININFNIESIDKMTRLTTDKKKFKDYINDNKTMQVEDLLFFYNYFVSDIHNSQNINPKIYSNRIYIENKEFLEQWPTIYNEDRLKNTILEDFLNENKNNYWNINYEEVKIPNNNQHKNNVVGLLKEFKYGNEHLGYVETTMLASNFFPGISNLTNENQFMIILDNEKNLLLKNNNLSLTSLINSKEFYEKINLFISGEEGSFNKKILNEEIFVTYKFIKPLKIFLVNGVLAKSTFTTFNTTRNIYIILAIIVVLILSFITYESVYGLLKNLDSIILSTREVELGNLKPVFLLKGDDEAVELSKHLQSMLIKIEVLISEKLKNQELTKNAEIKALQTQINAHFIHNTLESIRMMAEIDDQIEITDSITALGKLIRYSMSWKSPLVQLSEEIQYVENYIKLLNIRHDYKIVLIVQVEDELLKYKILKMSIQPIIENAVKYGINPFQSDGVIKIRAIKEDENVIIEISDSGAGMNEETVLKINKNISNIIIEATEETNGIGLINISQRIKFLYGKEYGLMVSSKENCFTKVSMILPSSYKESYTV